jgi:formylglycine-generating enzyme required for sulfatase activity
MIQLPPMPDGKVFAITESEITRMQFHRVLRQISPHVANARVASWEGCPAPLEAHEPDLPITCITPAEAAAYANKLTKFESRNTAQQLTVCYGVSDQFVNRNCSGYRLPTVAEWKHAATEGAPGAYADTGERAECSLAHLPNCGEEKQHPHKVKSHEPSPWHLYDMYGNAAEIVMTDDGTNWHALGGSWQNASDITAMPSNFRGSAVGMRIVRMQVR